MTLEEQIHSLRQMSSRGLIKWLSRSGFCVSVLCFILGVQAASPPYFMLAAVSALLAYAALQTEPHVRRAAQALDSLDRRTEFIQISIESLSESQSFHALVPDSQSRAWKFEFIPQGWKPSAGTIQAELRFMSGVAWPALLVTSAGLIYPRYEPKLQSTAGTITE